jgi:hypothetical protein
MSSMLSGLLSGLGLSGDQPPQVTVVQPTLDAALLEQARKAITGATLLAVDCEGVDLCREGSICIVQVSTPSHCFLFDVVGLGPRHKIVEFLKDILENPKITKIIHDCKMDSDALYHLLGIKLVGVHDTQACDVLLRNCGEHNLNNTLVENGCRSNVVRDGNVYESNPRFWATRPMTPMMIDWASGDVASLFELYNIQMAKAASPHMRERFKLTSEEKAEKLRHMITEVRCSPSIVCVLPVCFVRHRMSVFCMPIVLRIVGCRNFMVTMMCAAAPRMPAIAWPGKRKALSLRKPRGSEA